jgi:hypothetical protein
MAKKQTRQCEHQAKRKEAREYLRDKKGPSKFCGNTHSSQAPTELVLGMPVGVMWINQEPTEHAKALVESIQKEIPSVEIQRAAGDVALLILAIPETQASEGAALVLKAQRAWKWKSALRRPQRLLLVLRNLCLQRKQSNPEKVVLRQLVQEAVRMLWEEQEGHRHAMTIGKAGSQHCGECSWWAYGPRCHERIQEWEQWIQHCHSSNIDVELERVTFTDGMICVDLEGEQRLLQIAMDNGDLVVIGLAESSSMEPVTETGFSRPGDERLEKKTQKTYPFAKTKTWQGSHDAIEVVYAQVEGLLDWEALARITKNSNIHSTSRRVIMDQGAWCDEELTMAWERYMQTEGLSQHVSCQHCNSTKKPLAVVTPGKLQQRRQLVCFCTNCWSFTSIQHCRATPMDISFFKQFNSETGKFHRALPYAEENTQEGFEGRSQIRN